MEGSVLEFAPRTTIGDDLFYKYNRNLSNDVNGSLESSDLPFFFPQTKTNARGCFDEGLAYPSAPPPPPSCPSLPCATPSPPSTLPKVISAGNLSLWRESRRHFRANETKRAPRRERSRFSRSKNNWRPLLSPFSLAPPTSPLARSDKSIAKLANVNRQLKVRDVSAYLSCAAKKNAR